jgi:type IV secretory pathway VirB2 component (pilin)
MAAAPAVGKWLEEMTRMKTLAILLVFFLGIGLFARKYNTLVRVLLIVCILSLVLYATFL